jgi:predicted nucleic acid-binding protein
MAEPIESHFMWRPQLRDPGDELVLEAAVNGRAEAIVTFNRRDFAGVPVQFGVDVLTPIEAIRRIR